MRSRGDLQLSGNGGSEKHGYCLAKYLLRQKINIVGHRPIEGYGNECEYMYKMQETAECKDLCY